MPLHCLFVAGRRGAPAASVSDWLPAAAPRVAGELTVVEIGRKRSANSGGGGEEAEESGAIELPCFEKATSISFYFHLRYVGLSVPPAGVFARLTELYLNGVWFIGACDLGEAVSSARCPCLQKLTLQDALELHMKSYSDFARFFVVNASMLESMTLELRFGNIGNNKWIRRQHELLQIENRASRGARFDFVSCVGSSSLLPEEQVHDMSIHDPFQRTIHQYFC